VSSCFSRDVELKGAIPMGLFSGLDPVHAYVLGFFGVTLSSPIILMVFRPFLNFELTLYKEYE